MTTASKTHLVLSRQMLCHIFLNRFFGLIAQLLYIPKRGLSIPFLSGKQMGLVLKWS
jgi:hypothetical protein